MATVLKASPIVRENVENLKLECEELKSSGITPFLKVILVGKHPPSVIYTRNKKKFMESLGAKCEILELDEQIPEVDFLEALKQVAEDKSVHGLFVQLPLPKSLSHIDVGQLVPSKKDVDGFHAKNLYKVLAGDCGEESFVSCTPKGIITMLKHHNIDIAGKSVAIIGRSLIVGKPLAMLMTNLNATVTLCHSRTKDLREVTRNADIIVAAIGKPRFITKSFLNPEKKSIVIDVGINHDQEGNLCGDVDYDDVQTLCSHITPVPGGVGKMTILSIGQNLIKAASNIAKES
jgi:methylenetetrahydrofolate dehydrogenase (NADP+)/methenyltetrahydrofolate cyclohydrolase